MGLYKFVFEQKGLYQIVVKVKALNEDGARDTLFEALEQTSDYDTVMDVNCEDITVVANNEPLVDNRTGCKCIFFHYKCTNTACVTEYISTLTRTRTSEGQRFIKLQVE